MNFTELYQRIRSIDEGTASEPTAPGGVIKTKNADGSVSYKPKVPGERLTSTLPATQAAKTTDTSDKDKAKAVNEECGGMPVGMMGMSSHQGQQDSVTMNISMNGSGAGGIRDLMSILRDIEGSNNTDVHSHDVSKLFGGDDIEVAFDEEMSDGGFGAASTTPDPTVSGIDAVTDIGAPINGGDHRKRQAGLPQGAPMHETLVNRLSALYNEIKEAKEEEFDALKHVKNPTKGEKEAAKDVKRGSYADRAAMLKSAETDGRLKKEGRTDEWSIGTDTPGSVGSFWGSDIARYPELSAIIKQMKPSDYTEYNAFNQRYPTKDSYAKVNSNGDAYYSIAVRYKANDEFNFINRYNRDNNNLTVGQWLSKAKNKLASAVTGSPEEKVPYKAYRYDQETGKGSNIISTKEKDFPTR